MNLVYIFIILKEHGIVSRLTELKHLKWCSVQEQGRTKALKWIRGNQLIKIISKKVKNKVESEVLIGCMLLQKYSNNLSYKPLLKNISYYSRFLNDFGEFQCF